MSNSQYPSSAYRSTPRLFTVHIDKMDDPQSPYAAAHRNPKGPGDARPTADQILKDNDRISTLSDLAILITGCSSGLGVETARALAATGATLYLTARNLTKAREALGADLLSNPKVNLLQLDLDSLTSVRSCAENFLSKSSKLNILITNAGIRHVAFAKTKDGFEHHMAVNHFSHFLLLKLLLPTLQASSTMNFQSRVVALSSGSHRNSPIEFDDINLENPGVYTPPKGYAQSKLANVYMTSEVTRRYGSSTNTNKPGVYGLAVMPGGIRTGLQQHGSNIIPEFLKSWYYIKNILNMRILNIQKSPEQGAATTVLAAVGRRFEGRGALYLEDCGESVPVKEGWGCLMGGMCLVGRIMRRMRGGCGVLVAGWLVWRMIEGDEEDGVSKDWFKNFILIHLSLGYCNR
ncbi:hypothetical protein H2200_001954 [Cladophialophora chaetospira]|uniref:Short-chain dehydrogenase n=1 Tax=Cladophialophora chaetospira TaxID=386627 RepID=A0AA39CQ56_9EURO|nr:hypothetical protein H2200_001954 [Cladophialophora chaetospira]